MEDAGLIRLKLAEQLYVVDRQNEAAEQARLALKFYRDRADAIGTAKALALSASYQWTSGNVGAWRPLLEEAIALLEPLGPTDALAGVLYSSAHHHMLARQHRAAIEHGQRALEMAKALNSITTSPGPPSLSAPPNSSPATPTAALSYCSAPEN